MKNLIKQIENGAKLKRVEFIDSLFKDNDNIDSILSKWQFTDLIPKSNYTKWSDISALREYLVKRYDIVKAKANQSVIDRINTISTSQDFESISISVEWKKSAMWGSNPSATAKVVFNDGTCQYFESGSIGGCGYDKCSTAVANCLNQVNGLLKLMYARKNKHISSRCEELFGYGAGGGSFLPYIEGGVGVSCYNKIMNSIGFKFQTISSGKAFDVYQITKLTKKDRKSL